MSSRPATLEERIARGGARAQKRSLWALPCPSCGAGAGSACKYSSGRTVPYRDTHKARIRARADVVAILNSDLLKATAKVELIRAALGLEPRPLDQLERVGGVRS